MLKDALPMIRTQLPGEKSQAVIARRKQNVPNAVHCSYPVVIKEGKGAMVEDLDGNIFLDWIGGVGVLNVGYSHPTVIEAVGVQANRFFHGMMNIVTHEPYVELTEKLNMLAPTKGEQKKTLLANSGAEAVENAVKIAKSASGRPNIIVFSGAFHGRTMLTMTMTAKKTYSHGLGPFPDGVYRAPFPNMYRKPAHLSDEAAVDYYIKQLEQVFVESSPAEHVAAIVVEPVLGEGGFIPAPFEWVQAVRRICDHHGIYLIADEVQTGFARSGKLFVANYWKAHGCPPDLLVMAKSIAAGIPLSAVTGDARIFDQVRTGVIGGTYGGNALGCSAALKVLEVIEEEQLAERATEIGNKLRSTFEKWQERYSVIGDVRGIGSMLGVEFITDQETKEPNPILVKGIIARAIRKGLLLESAGTHGNVIRFLAPLVITEDQLDKGIEIFNQSLNEAIEEINQQNRR